jgi:xylulose-5-phosphate/fructose-6-phosphate phosphoketolase
MIVLRTPKGWTGPKIVDGKQVEGTWRSHQVPLAETRTNASTAPARDLDAQLQARGAVRREGRLPPELAALAPTASAEWAPTRTPTAACCCAS